jgi:hypothetical protein
MQEEEEGLLFIDFKFLNYLKPFCNHKINVNDGGCQSKGYSWVVLCLDPRSSVARVNGFEKMNSSRDWVECGVSHVLFKVEILI